MYGLRLLSGNWYVIHLDSGAVMPWPITKHMYEDGYGYESHYFDYMADWSKRKRHRWFGKKKKAYLKRNNMLETTSSFVLEAHCLDCCDAIPQTYYGAKKVKAKKKEAEMANITLNTANTVDPTEKQREHLTFRLRDVYDAKCTDLRKHFKTDPVPLPRTLGELIQQIKDGDYTVDDKYISAKNYHLTDLMYYHIRWTKDKADDEGFAKALGVLDDSYQIVLDTIKILSPEEGLKALREFEARTFH